MHLFEKDKEYYFAMFEPPGERFQPTQREQLDAGPQHGPDEPPQQCQLQCTLGKVNQIQIQIRTDVSIAKYSPLFLSQKDK